MKKSLFAILFAIISIPVFSQLINAPKDTLLAKLAMAKEDTTKVWLLLSLSGAYQRNIPDSAVYYAKLGGVLTTKLDYKLGRLGYLSILSNAYNIQRKTDSSLPLNLQQLELAKTFNNPGRLSAAYSNIGGTYFIRQDYQKCIEYNLLAVNIAEKNNLVERLGIPYNNLAASYNNIGDIQKGYEYGLKAINLLNKTQSNNPVLDMAYLNAGRAMVDLKRLDSGLLLLQQCKEVATKLNDRYNIAESELNINGVLARLGRFNEMKGNAEEALAILTALKDDGGINRSLYSMAGYLFYTNRVKESREYVLKALEIAKKNNFQIELANDYAFLSDIDLRLNNIPSYITNGFLADSVQQAMKDKEIRKNSEDAAAKYNLDKKQWEINNLTQQQKDEQLILKQRNTINRVLAGLVLAGLLAGLLYYRNAKQKNKLLTAQDALKQQRIAELEKEKQLLAAESVLQGQEEERKRLAKDLHDGLGGILSSVKYTFANVHNNFVVTPENAESFDRGMVMLDKSIVELRRVAHNMMPEALMRLGLTSALEDFCQGINQSGAIQLTCQFYKLDDNSIPLNKAAVVYRIIQELVNNILKHAAAKTALIQLVRKDNALSITVEDDGNGFDTNILQQKKGIGFINLQNRVTYLGGYMDIQSAAGKGTSINIEIPEVVS